MLFDCFETIILKIDSIPSIPLLLKELLLLGCEVFIKSSSEVSDPGIAAQVLWFVAEPWLTRTEVSVVAQRPLRWT